MATFRLPILGANTKPDSGVFPDTIGNQITEATAPSIGTQLCFVLADGGADEGLYGNFSVPKNFVGSGAIVARGVLDGAPGAADTLGFAVRGHAVAHGEAADATYAAEDAASATIGSNGDAHSDEDEVEEVITLSNIGTLSVDDTVYFYFYIDASGTSYAGNFLLTGLFFQYTDT